MINAFNFNVGDNVIIVQKSSNTALEDVGYIKNISEEAAVIELPNGDTIVEPKENLYPFLDLKAKDKVKHHSVVVARAKELFSMWATPHSKTYIDQEGEVGEVSDVNGVLATVNFKNGPFVSVTGAFERAKISDLKCSCQTSLLMTRGCQCGAIKREKRWNS